MALRTPAQAMSPEEFEEQRAAAQEDDVEHLIEDFDSAAEWNVYVAANEAQHAASESGSTTRTLRNWEYLGKSAGLVLLLVLAMKGAESIGRRV